MSARTGCLPERVAQVEPAALFLAASRVADQRPAEHVIDADGRLRGERIVIAHHGDDVLAPDHPVAERALAHLRQQRAEREIDGPVHDHLFQRRGGSLNQVDGHAWILRLELPQHRREVGGADAWVTADRHARDEVVERAAGRVNAALQLEQRRQGMPAEKFARFGHAHRPGLAVEQADAEGMLERRYVGADPGLGQVQHEGGGTEAALVRHREETAQPGGLQ